MGLGVADAELADDDVPLSSATSNPITSFFNGVRVERTKSGAVRIEALPEAADSLLALFEGMSKLLASARS